MDSIKRALELAKAAASNNRRTEVTLGFAEGARITPNDSHIREIRLDPKHLETKRIVAHGTSSEHGHYYDMLRTQVLQEMDKNNWQFLAVTSPTPECGKTVTACNLAMSIARLQERAVLLADLDLRRPMVATYLGLEQTAGVLDVLENRTSLAEAVINTTAGPTGIMVLPGSTSSFSSEWMTSQTMNAVLQAIKRDFRSRIVIFDLPPMLLGDDVISILPKMDAVLLVAGVGTTTVADMKECQKHLPRTPVVRVVVNKAPEIANSYYGYY